MAKCVSLQGYVRKRCKSELTFSYILIILELISCTVQLKKNTGLLFATRVSMYHQLVRMLTFSRCKIHLFVIVEHMLESLYTEKKNSFLWWSVEDELSTFTA